MAEAPLLCGYLIVGADELKRSRAVARMKARLEKSGMAAFNLDERNMTHDPQIADIIASLNTLPMGSDFRLVILNGCDKLPKAVSEPLVSYFENPSPTTVCLIVANTLAKSTRLYKAVAKLGPKALVDCAPKKGREVPQQVVSMARAYGKTIDIMAAEELVSRVGENSRMLDNELKRLSAMLEGESISRSDIEALVARTAEVKPWDLLNAVSARDMKRALELYQLQPPRSEVRLWLRVCASLSVPKHSMPAGKAETLPRFWAFRAGRFETTLAGRASTVWKSSFAPCVLPLMLRRHSRGLQIPSLPCAFGSYRSSNEARKTREA